SPIEVAPFEVGMLVPVRNSPPVRFPGPSYTALRLRLRNQPRINVESAVARQVSAVVRFYDVAGNSLFSMDGRWADSPQPSERDPSQDYVATSLAVPFPLGLARSLDLVFKRPGEATCIAINNDNFRGS